MSAEGKKKRGESGMSKAKSSPFRLNGLPVDWTARKMGVYTVPSDHTGTHMVRGAIGGMLAAKMGYSFVPSNRFASLVDDSLPKCTAAEIVFNNL